MNVWPAGDERFAPRTQHERYHTGGHRNLPWQDGFEGGQQRVPLAPGDAVLMPVMAPHFVANGDAPSISLSITWRSEWSYRESERSEEHTSELQSLMRISYAVFCLKK